LSQHANTSQTRRS